jgi:tryptophanyl-tRNA synthetase
VKPVVLSGIQPSGELHLGNYLGAIQEHLRIDAEKNDALFFIADYHALTLLRDAKMLKEYTYDIVATYLALGLDEKAVIFRQSDIPQTTELMWLLACTTGKGLLDRAPAYKEKVEKGLPATMGLYTYPLLMAADILLFGSNVVPVGQDQIPHIEIAKDVAQAFNAHYGPVLTIPEYRLTSSPKVPGTDV